MAISRIKTDGIQDEAVTSAKIGDNIDLDGQFVRVPHGTTAERPSSPAAGYLRFNTDQGTLEQWNTNTNSWAGVDSPPIITSLAYTGSVTAADPAGGETITLTGTNFKTGANVTVGGTTAPTISVVNSTTITFTTPAKTAGDYDVTVTNTNGLQATLTNGISYNGLPAFTTAAGNVGSIAEDVTMSTITIVAAEPDGGTLSYSITSGALPTGVSMSSAGAITGTPNVNVTSDTTYNFTVTATDDENQTNSRAFNLIVLRPVYATSLDNSLKFDKDQRQFLARTPSSAGNQKTWTFSCWVKRSVIEQNHILTAYSSSSDTTNIAFDYGSGENLQWYDYISGYRIQLTTTQKFRDVAGWYHLLFALDTTQATSSDRAKIYVNGVRVTDFVEEIYPSQNADLKMNTAIQHRIGNSDQFNRDFDGYMSDVYFIDGQALSPTDFAEEYYGVWTPKAYSGTYGTNGYHLDFDGDAEDSSGNANHWISNGFGGVLEKFDGSTKVYPTTLWRVLDGDNSTAYGAQGPNTSTSASIVYTPTTPITVNSSLKFKYSTGQTDCKYRINGGSYVNLGSSGTVDFNTGFTGTLTSIEWYVANSNSLINVYDLRVDDVQVVNSDTGYDSVSDSPTTNFATFNHINFPVMTFGSGALKITTTTNNTTVYGTQSIPDTGKWYFEMEATDYVSGGGSWNGLGYETHLGDNELSQDGIRLATYYGGIYVNNSVQSGGYGNTGNGVDQTADGDVYSFAIDMDNELFYIAKNGTWYNSADPSAGTGGLDISANITAKGTKPYVPAVGRGGSHNETYTWNFGQDSTFAGNRTAASNADANGVGEFAYTVPTNFLSLCAKNLSEGAIAVNTNDRPDDYFNTVTYTGNNGTQTISDVGFAPDLVWAKNRTTNGYHHEFYDSVRGDNNRLFSSQNSGELTGYLALESNGFSLTSGGGINTNGDAHVAWSWKAGGAPTATNTAGVGAVPTSGSVLIDGSASTSALAGTIAADKISTNSKAGFSIVKYIGNGSGGATVAHGLGDTPDMIILKAYGLASNWRVYVNGVSLSNTLFLNSTNTQTADGDRISAVDSTTFTLSSGNGAVNGNAEPYIAYCWKSVPGYSKMGTFTGQGDKTYVHTGFKPAFLMVKSFNTAAHHWAMYDNKRNTYNVINKYLYANSSGPESTADRVDFVSNGFVGRANNYDISQSGVGFVYMAFAEDPFKYVEAR